MREILIAGAYNPQKDPQYMLVVQESVKHSHVLRLTRKELKRLKNHIEDLLDNHGR